MGIIMYICCRYPLKDMQRSCAGAQCEGCVSAQVIGWVPTGWTYENKRNMFPVKRKGNCSIHLVPYSEHSSYNELQTYVKFLRPHEACIQPSLA